MKCDVINRDCINCGDCVLLRALADDSTDVSPAKGDDDE